MAKLKIKKEDLVEVISGEHKGERGKVISVDITKNRAIVEGVNKVSRHTKASAKHPNGGIVEKEAPVHISNLKLVFNGKAVRVGRMKNEEGTIVRVAKVAGDEKGKNKLEVIK
ncbi:MAG: large subunit ribosomal protein L24 [Bacteroidetes bacterium]|nr:MAG: large subunit ribosomal protein L24 [Bacteroidota bacterium]